MDEIIEASREVMRIAMFGHRVGCEGKPHASTRANEYDPRCNYCVALHKLADRLDEYEEDQ